MSIGQELLDVPFPDMIFKMANAIAQGQRRLDKNSLDTALALAKATVKVIPEFFEIVTTKPDYQLQNSDGIDVVDAKGDPVMIKGAIEVQSKAGDPVKMTLMQAGLLPTFYQFTESIIEVKISISHRSSMQTEFESGSDFSVSTEAEAHGSLFGFGGSGSVSTTFASHVNLKASSSFEYSAEGSSLLRTTLKPVPPPARLIPRIVTVDNTVTPAKVTFNA